MTRRRSPAQRAPKTKDEVIVLAERYAVIAATVARINADRDERKALADSAADQAIAPLEVEAKDLFAQLKTFWAVAGDEVTGGKARSAELGGCEIGMRLTPRKLVHMHGKDGDAAVVLQLTGYAEALTKVTFSLDKAAIVRRLDEEAAAKAAAAKPDHHGEPGLAALGFSTKQTDEFFVAPIAADAPGGTGA